MTSEELERRLRQEPELVLITRGRRTGEHHEVTVWFAYEDGVVWLRADRDADWYRNLRRDPLCRLRVGTLEVEGRLEPVQDEDVALRHVVELWRAKYGVDYVSDWYVDRGRVPVRIRVLA